MAKKRQPGEVNRSQAIRELLKENSSIKCVDAIAALAEKGVKITSSLFYMVKGNMAGRKKRRRKNRKQAVQVATASGSSDALATVLKVKKLAAEVGGFRTLKELVDALSK